MFYTLVAGGLGYIGSHVVVELIKNGYKVIIADDLSNSDLSKLVEIKTIIAESEEDKNQFFFVKTDFMNEDEVRKLFELYKIDAVVNLAGLKSVPDSIIYPITYYQTNITIMTNILKIMEEFGCYNLIFSSSSTVYGNTSETPLKEDQPIGFGITNPYGCTKYLIEIILKNLSETHSKWNICSLRYFNPLGSCCHNGLLGDTPKNLGSNVMPAIINSLANKKDFCIFGKDYDTADGTAERDYIHVIDLANAHVKALDKLESGYKVFNVGIGKPISVEKLVNHFKETNGVNVNIKYESAREGDLPVSYTDTRKITEELNWFPKYDLTDMVKSCYLTYLHTFEKRNEF